MRSSERQDRRDIKPMAEADATAAKNAERKKRSGTRAFGLVLPLVVFAALSGAAFAAIPRAGADAETAQGAATVQTTTTSPSAAEAGIATDSGETQQAASAAVDLEAALHQAVVTAPELSGLTVGDSASTETPTGSWATIDLPTEGGRWVVIWFQEGVGDITDKLATAPAPAQGRSDVSTFVERTDGELTVYVQDQAGNVLHLGLPLIGESANVPSEFADVSDAAAAALAEDLLAKVSGR
ncbi:MAG: hypothetical protein AB1Z57_05255 [Acidimicrobiia bacterium]